jgi:Protein of unknown function (DUF3037)
MPSKFIIFQYVPNPLADERINIGLIAFNDKVVKPKFLHNWERVQKFNLGDINFLKDFAAQASQQLPEILASQGSNKVSIYDQLGQMSKIYTNTIQITEPRASLKDVDELANEIYARFLVEPTRPVHSRFRNRQDAKRLTTKEFRNALKKYEIEARDYLKTSYSISGIRGQHDFDAVVANGSPYFAAHGISFEVHEPKTLLDAVAWRVEDIKASNRDFPIAIVMLPPVQEIPDYDNLQSAYQDTSRVYKDLGADILLEDEVSKWVNQHINLIPSSSVHK